MSYSSHPAVRELDAVLQSLPALKPPGVNKAKVEASTKICMDPQNVSVEPYLVESLSSAFRKSPASHKLGVLYIIDSITRQWVAAGAAHASGLRRMTESLPALMNEMIPVTPENQKEKLSKLIDIWTTSKTFPSNMLADFKTRLLNPSAPQMQLPASSANKPVFSAPSNPANLLAALAAPPPAPAPQAQVGAGAPLANNAPTNALLAALGLAPPTQQPANPPAPLPFAQNGHNVAFPPQPPALPQNGSAMGLQFSGNHVAPPPPSNPNPLAALFSGLQAGAPAAPADPNALASQISQIQMIQTLSQLGPDALKTIAAALSGGGMQPPVPAAQVPVPPAVQQPQYGQMPQGNQSYGREDAVQDLRARSRSPDFKPNRFSPPNRRDSPTYGTYNPSGPSNNGPRGSEHERGRRGRRGGRNDYRQRSPPNTRDRDEDSHPRSNQPKPMGFDNKLPEGHIKVLSRTLFVGGVKTSEPELKNFFRQFGGVQTCIVNHDKRHAFLKLITHQDAMATKQAVWNLPEAEYRGLFERVNWAVGFGPTQCADYNIGESVIPIELLTDADRKWMLNAEFGGTGGTPIKTGIVVEEPDIEIGAGPSSKAIHRRGGGTSGGGGQGGRGNFFGRRGGGDNHHHQNNSGRYRKVDRPEPPVVPEANTIGPPPPVPTFGAPIPGLPMNFR